LAETNRYLSTTIILVLEQLKIIIQDLNISEEDKALVFEQIKAAQKAIAVAEFKYSRTLFDKAAITNILNASIKEIEEQKKIVEEAKNEIAKNMFELDKQKQVIEIKNRVLNETMTNLKETQSQLIQSEKMASLGELTAGIAHEIQNPLNFVNNFSDINRELIEEMKAAINEGNLEEAKVLANDISTNEQKINFHGKRADGIVKGMLQHSRSSNNIKEPVNINVLADEYLRLAYHGLRAKDKSFNATIKTDYDESIGSITAVPQDIGRAMLNLITNAFYAVTEKKKTHPNNYEPTVVVNTKKAGNKAEIRVIDNGNGIPQKVLDKIFQPFFTTKPTGQGTGLGLSLCYDIIQAHGGNLKVETEEGSGTTFIIELPTM
jgi:two-component system, NtrC family, sensor kinase